MAAAAMRQRSQHPRTTTNDGYRYRIAVAERGLRSCHLRRDGIPAWAMHVCLYCNKVLYCFLLQVHCSEFFNNTARHISSSTSPCPLCECAVWLPRASERSKKRFPHNCDHYRTHVVCSMQIPGFQRSTLHLLYSTACTSNPMSHGMAATTFLTI